MEPECGFAGNRNWLQGESQRVMQEPGLGSGRLWDRQTKDSFLQTPHSSRGSKVPGQHQAAMDMNI